MTSEFDITLKMISQQTHFEIGVHCKTRHNYFFYVPLSSYKSVHVSAVDLGINLASFFPCNQLTATSYIYQSLGDVEWYVKMKQSA